MRITFLSGNPNLSGGTRVIATHAQHLVEAGDTVGIVGTPLGGAPISQRVRRVLNGGGWSEPPSQRGSHLDGRGLDVRLIDRYRPITDSDVPDGDVVIATWWETAEWVARLSPSKGAKVYFIQHHEVVFDSEPLDRVRATYRLPLHQITISKWLVDLMKNTYGASEVAHVPNSVDTSLFHAPPRAKQATPTIGFMYSTAPFKSCGVTLRALERVRQVFPDLKIIAFGTKPPSADLPLPSGTVFEECPPQVRLRDLYAQCDVWMCGSHAEGFHLPPLEAMACRCPVVSTRVGGPIDTIEEGVNGCLVDVGDSEALAASAVGVLRLSEAGWRAMSDAAYRTATSYAWRQATARFRQALEAAVRAPQTWKRSGLLRVAQE